MSKAEDKNNDMEKLNAQAPEEDEEQELEPTLNELLNNTYMQWVFVGGKGGVGKTTTSCSIAIQLAAQRKNVLILSTDPAHNLSDAFGQKFSNSPTLVKDFENLYAMELDPTMKVNTAFKVKGEDEFGLFKMIPELMSAFPGIDEAMGFAQLMEAIQTMNYSVIVFDTAPTGHTLRLLSFPDLLDKADKKFSEMKDKMPGIFSMFDSMNSSAPSSEGGGLGLNFDNLRAVTASIRQIFRDPLRTTFVCVCIPEFLSLYETERLIQELTKNDMDASYIVVNQILFPIKECDEIADVECAIPKAIADKATDPEVSNFLERYELLTKKASALEKSHMARRRMQSKYLSQIRDLYAYDFHVVPMPLRGDEVRGLESLLEFGKDLLTPKQMPIVE